MTIAVKDGNGALQTVKTIDDLLALIALASKQDTGNGTLASILAKITADPATATGQAAIIAAIGGIPGGGGGGDASEATLVSIDGHVDGLETLVAATNAALTTLNGQTDTIETLIASTNTKLDTLDTTMSDAIVDTVAHDAADSGNPLKIGAKAIAGLSTATLVAVADRTDLYAGLDGALITRPHCGLSDIVTGNATNTDGTSTSCIAAAGAGIKTYLTSIILANTSAVAITVDVKDGSTTKFTLPLPAGSGCIFNPPVPIPGTANTAWSFDPSAAATTVTCSMVGFKSKV